MKQISEFKAAELLIQGEVVALPTETVYGLAAHALNLKAVTKIYEAKQRPFFDPLIVHVYESKDAWQWVSHKNQAAEILAEAFWPGPLTLILPKSKEIPDLVTAGLPFVGLRVPSHPITRNILQHSNLPLAAPSANRFQSLSPTTLKDVETELGDVITYGVDGGACTVGVESTVVDVSKESDIRILRPGGISQENIHAVLSSQGFNLSISSKVIVENLSLAPGQSALHYAPGTPMLPLFLFTPEIINASKRVAFLGLEEPPEMLKKNFFHLEILSSKLEEAAQQLFGALRRLDQMDLDLIVWGTVPEQGLGRAIKDRLQRGSQQRMKSFHELD